MARTKGAKDLKPRVGNKQSNRLPKIPQDKVLQYKLQILGMLERGEALTLTECAEKLNVDAAKVHFWSSQDRDFQAMIHLAHEVQADKIEVEFSKHANFIPKMMLLKAWRPIYKDNFKVDVTNSKLEDMLEELKQLGKKQNEKESV